MKNTIAQRIADFLKDFPPFDQLSKVECYQLAQEVEVVYLPQHDVLFEQGVATHEFFYVVNQGTINLSIKHNSGHRLVDVCDEGDILGLRPYFAEQDYAMKASAKTESLLYAIPFKAFKPYLSEPAIAQFLLQSFASNQRQPLAKTHKGQLLSQNLTSTPATTKLDIDYFQHIKFTTSVYTVSPSTSIVEVAKQMSKRGISSAIISAQQLPFGIITDKDLRRFVATGLVSHHAEVQDIMSAPVYCVKPDISVAQAQLQLLQNQVGHLCITEDGSPESPLLGVLSEHDIVTAQANNPIALLKALKRAKTTHDLKHVRHQLTQLLQAYLSTDLPISHCLELTEGLHEALFERCAEISLAQMPTTPPCSFTWLFLGSQARGEQLLLTDQDHALVFEDVPDSQFKTVQAYFLQLGQHLSEVLAEVGFEFCPAQMMANNPDYCLSLEQWKQQFRQWIKSPTEQRILLCSVFFDFKRVYGSQDLEDQLRKQVYSLLRKDDTFYAYLASDALKNPPPLGFFKQFIVEDDGAHKDEFDLKARAIMPLVDAARVLTLSVEVAGVNSTVERFKLMANREPQNANLYHSCIRSFYDLLRYRTDSGFAQEDSGRFVNLKTLSKHDKNRLKYAFKPINNLQTNLKTRFNLSFFT